MPSIATNNKFGNGLYLNGSGYIEVLHSQSLNFELTDPFSIISYVYARNTDDFGAIVQKRTVNGRNGYSLSLENLSNSTFRFVGALANNGVYRRVVTRAFNKNSLYHITFSNLDGTVANMKIFVNGISETLTVTHNASITSIQNDANLALGRIQDSSGVYNFFNGYLFDTKMFNKELSQSEIISLYNRPFKIPNTAKSNLVADWRFQEKTGDFIKDSSINNNHGTCINMTTNLSPANAHVDGYTLKPFDKHHIIGDGLKFIPAAPNDFVLVPDSPSLAMGVDDFSISMWLTVLGNNTDPNMRLIGKYKGDGNNGIGFFTALSNTTFQPVFTTRVSGTDVNSPRISSNKGLQVGKLHHLVFVKKTQTRNNWEIWIDNEKQAFTASGNTVLTGATDNNVELVISRVQYRLLSGAISHNDTTSFCFNGIIYDTKIVKTALTKEQINEMYLNPKSLPSDLDSSLVAANWTYDQTEGDILTDLSGNGNIGTLTNMNTVKGVTNQWIDKDGNPKI